MSVSELFKEVEGRFDVDLGTKHHFSSGVYAKEMKFPKGYVAVSHQHTYDHLSILSAGKVLVETDVDHKVYNAPAVVEIRAGLNHAIHALEDCVWFCIHATDITNEEDVDQVLIKKEGN